MARFEAARVQHHVAIRVRRVLHDRRITQETFAASIDWTPGRLSRALNGATPTALDDLLLLMSASESSLGAVAQDARLAPEGNLAQFEFLATFLAKIQENVQAEIARSAPTRPSS